MRAVGFIVAVALAAATSGCAPRVAVVSTEKNAYVVSAGLFGLVSSMYHCKADTGRPVCTEVEETE
jgi:hypothetical protein